MNIRRVLLTVGKRTTLVGMALLLAFIDAGQVAAQVSDEDPHKGDLYYYTNNNIIFYEGGELHCGPGGTAISGGAAAVLQAQKNLDSRWIPVILNASKESNVDPIAMASLLFWEHRGFPKYGEGPNSSESDSIGRGPWQITSGSWNDAFGDYRTMVYDPLVSTKAAAELVSSWGGKAGSPIGSIDQDFSKLKNIPSMATVAKNYNAGKYTWRDPAVATYKQSGRAWLAPDHNWNKVIIDIDEGLTKSDVIDDYILGMTFAYYTMATNTGQLSKGGGTNTKTFVQEALKNAEKIKTFKFGEGGTDADGNVSNDCGDGTVSAGNGNIRDTALGLAWPNQKKDGHQYKSDARRSFQVAMPSVQGTSTANSVFEGRTAWSDCGVFVATVVRYSKADTKYYLRGTGEQVQYVKRNGKKSDPNRKYDVFDGDNNPYIRDDGKLLPGDIMIVNGDGVGHTYIYTGPYKGDDGNKYDSASASWGDHVPMASHVYFTQGGYKYVVARLRINGGAAATTATGATP